MPSIKDFASGRSDIHNIDPKKIQIKPGWNLRFRDDPELEEHIENLAKSIRNNGFLKSHPLEVVIENGQLYVVDGECRLTAVLRNIKYHNLDIKTVPCVMSTLNDEERSASLLVHNSGKPFAPLEEAVGIVRLLGYGWTPQEVADKIGKSITHISNRVLLAKANEETKKMVREKAASATAVWTAMRETGGDAAAAHEKIQEQVKKKGKATIASVKTTPKVGSAVALRKCTAALREIVKATQEAQTGQEAVILRLIQARAQNALDEARPAEIAAVGTEIEHKARSGNT